MSARGTIEGLATPHPLGALLPGLYQDDDLVQRFMAGLDEVLAPVIGVLDSGEAYVDPMLAPADFLAWLAQWVGVELDDSWPEARQRALVAHASDLYAWRGTVRGLARLVAITTGLDAEIVESGGVGWTGSAAPAGGLPGSPAAAMIVRLRVPAGHDEPVDLDRIDRMIATAKPAHVLHKVELLGASPPPARKRAAPPAPPADPGEEA